MAVLSGFRMTPLARVLKLAACLPLVVASLEVNAVEVIDQPVTIDGNTPLKDYQVINGGELTANGASLLSVQAIPGGKVFLNDSLIDSTARNAVELEDAMAVINGGRITGLSTGLVLAQSAAGVGSSAEVSGSQIYGQLQGILVSSASTLTLKDTLVAGTGANSIGIRLAPGATAQIAGGSVTGQLAGIRLVGESTPSGTTTLNLDGAHVEGIAGPALLVGSSTVTQAKVLVSNGSTLQGGNGRIVEVNRGATLDMTVDNSHLTGDVVVDTGGAASLTLQNQASLTGRLENVAQLAVNSQARWNMVDNGQVENLSMDGGSISFGGARDFYTLSVGNLSGKGTFLMDVDFGQAQNDFLNITGHATGDHSLLIGSTGSDPLADTSLHVVHAASGDASFSLAGGPVDLGTWSYDLVKQGSNDWYLDAATRQISPGAGSVIALFNAAPTVWYGELSTLRLRMGELRFNGGKPGLWLRTYGNRFDAEGAGGVGYRQSQHGFSLGADTALALGDGQWLAGVMAGQSDSDLSLKRGTTGQIDSYYAGAYATWLDNDSGYYFDGVFKVNRLRNQSKVQLSDGNRTGGDYANWASGASAEFGRHIKLDQGWFVEPYGQLSAMVAQGANYTLDNGMRAEGDRARSLQAKAGATFGRNIDLGQGRSVQPYVRTALAHEFVKRNEVQVNDNVFNNNLSGSRAELGLGASLALSEAFQLHADFEYGSGSRVDQPWGANLGLRYSW